MSRAADLLAKLRGKKYVRQLMADEYGVENLHDVLRSGVDQLFSKDASDDSTVEQLLGIQPAAKAVPVSGYGATVEALLGLPSPSAGSKAVRKSAAPGAVKFNPAIHDPAYGAMCVPKSTAPGTIKFDPAIHDPAYGAMCVPKK